MYGALSFYKICKEHGIKPIFGLTATVIIKNEPYPFVLLAKNNSGYRNLLKLSSLLQTKFPKGLPLSFFKQYSRDLFVITPGRQGLIEQLLINGQIAEAGKAVEFFKACSIPILLHILTKSRLAGRAAIKWKNCGAERNDQSSDCRNERCFICWKGWCICTPLFAGD